MAFRTAVASTSPLLVAAVLFDRVRSTMISKEYVGFWTCDAPLTPEEVKEDAPILEALQLPDGMTLCRLEVFVHGRLYEWEKVEARTL